VVFDGVRYTVHDLGPGESYSDSFWTAHAKGYDVAFIGDVVLNQEHAYLSDGHSTEWLRNIDVVRKATSNVKVLYPGHGLAGGSELFDFEKQYLEFYRTAVHDLAQGRASLNDDEKKELTDRMIKYLPIGHLTFLIPLGADPVARELAGTHQEGR
jgi:hypothetical protein